MPTTSPLQALAIPVASDAPDGATQIVNLAKAAEQRLVMRFTSAAARTSAFSAAAVSPTDGMLCYRADAPGLNKFEYYNSTAGAWRVHGAYQDSSTVAGAAAGSVTFPAIPTYLRRLTVGIRARGTNTSTFVQATLQVGGDTASFYRAQWHFTQNGGAPGGTQLTASSGPCFVGYVPAASSSANQFGVVTVDIVGWDKPSASSLPINGQGGYFDTTLNYVSSRSVGSYVGTATYNALTLLPNTGSWDVGSEFVLTGWE